MKKLARTWRLEELTLLFPGCLLLLHSCWEWNLLFLWWEILLSTTLQIWKTKTIVLTGKENDGLLFRFYSAERFAQAGERSTTFPLRSSAPRSHWLRWINVLSCYWGQLPSQSTVNSKMVWVRRDPKDHPCHGQDTFHCSRLVKVPSHLEKLHKAFVLSHVREFTYCSYTHGTSRILKLCSGN